MADLEEYAMLEAAVDGKPAPPGEANGKPRDSSPRKDRGEGGDRERGSSKDKRRRSRSRSKDRDRKRSSRSKDRDNKERRRSRSKDRERRRSRSRDRHHSSRDRDRDRPRHSRSRERAERDRAERERPRHREVTPPEVRLAREKERELKELERATRTVFGFNLSVKADERDIWEFFSKVGEVTDIRIITDRHTRKSKGMAYIEFSRQEAVFSALALTGQPFMGQPVMVKPAEAEKNVAWEAAQAAKANQSDAAALLAAAGLAVPGALPPPPPGGGGPGAGLPLPGPPPAPLTLHVTGFPVGLGEAELRQLLAPFGAIVEVAMVPDAAGLLSACTVTYARQQDGMAAAGHWNGNQLLGSTLAVTPQLPEGAAPPPPGGELAGIPRASAGAAAAMAQLGPSAHEGSVMVGDLDDEELGGGGGGGGGLKLDSTARAALMSRLAGGAGAGSVPLPVAPALPAAPPPLPGVDPAVAYAQGVLGPPSPIPTQCLLLKNVWRAEQTAEPGWEGEVTEDMAEELGKCGQLLHMHIDTASMGFVYVKFVAVEGAQAAHKLLNGRYYQGNQIICEYQFAQPYNAHFGLA